MIGKNAVYTAVGKTGSEPNNGTLTIQQNGETVGTFSANQATDETINIEASEQVQSDWTQTDTTAVDFIKNKPENIHVITNKTVAGSGGIFYIDITSDISTIDTNTVLFIQLNGLNIQNNYSEIKIKHGDTFYPIHVYSNGTSIVVNNNIIRPYNNLLLFKSSTAFILIDKQSVYNETIYGKVNNQGSAQGKYIDNTQGLPPYKGQILIAKFEATNSAINATINTTYTNSNPSNGKPVYYNGHAIDNTCLDRAGVAGHTTLYIYDGSHWVWLADDVERHATTQDITATDLQTAVTNATLNPKQFYYETDNGKLLFALTNSTYGEITLTV